MTILAWVFVATLLGTEQPVAFTFTSSVACVQMSNVMAAGGHEVSGCASVRLTVAINGSN